jgi:hypothetical protein
MASPKAKGTTTSAREVASNLAAFETGNGMQHGPVGIAIALVAALVLLPVAAFIRFLRRG